MCETCFAKCYPYCNVRNDNPPFYGFQVPSSRSFTMDLICIGSW